MTARNSSNKDPYVVLAYIMHGCILYPTITNKGFRPVNKSDHSTYFSISIKEIIPNFRIVIFHVIALDLTIVDIKRGSRNISKESTHLIDTIHIAITGCNIFSRIAAILHSRQ